ncbi:hypothetical protein QJS66_08160 [Kocuria rhizophila]|nr:hypothetical protein QJS66_08160 [Kocuria rhizophila]
MSSIDTLVSTARATRGTSPRHGPDGPRGQDPHRVAVGYLPPPPPRTSGTSFAVGTGDAHAWPELLLRERGGGCARADPRRPRRPAGRRRTPARATPPTSRAGRVAARAQHERGSQRPAQWPA